MTGVLLKPAPVTWLAHSFSLSETTLPAANYLDKTGERPQCRVLPLAERLLAELTETGQVDVQSDRQVFTVRAKRTLGEETLQVAIFQGDVLREPYQPAPAVELLALLDRVTPVLRLCQSRKGLPVGRRRVESIIWRYLHPDFRGTCRGRRAALRITDRGTALCPLGELTLDELWGRLPFEKLTEEERRDAEQFFASRRSK